MDVIVFLAHPRRLICKKNSEMGRSENGAMQARDSPARGSSGSAPPSHLSGIICITAVYALNPVSLLRHRIDDNLQRNAEIHNTIIYKKLNSKLPDGTKIINCKSFEDVEVMFYTDFDAYHWWPKAPALDSLQDLGYRFAAFRSHTEQHLPDYITQDTSIILLQDELK
jgi:hypothetical protein